MTNTRGYIALLTALILSAVVTGLAFTTGTMSFFARFDALLAEGKEEAQIHADACAHVALLLLAEDPWYLPPPGGETISITENERCRIESVISNDTEVTITVSASSLGSRVRTVIVSKRIPPVPLSIISWTRE